MSVTCLEAVRCKRQCAIAPRVLLRSECVSEQPGFGPGVNTKSVGLLMLAVEPVLPLSPHARLALNGSQRSTLLPDLVVHVALG